MINNKSTMCNWESNPAGVNKVTFKSTRCLTTKAIKNYYSGNTETLFSMLHPDIIMLSVGENQLIEGRENVKKMFGGKEDIGIKYDIISMSCKPYSLTKRSCYVLVDMQIMIDYPDGKGIKINQRLTIDWVYSTILEKDGEIRTGWFALHIHISMPMYINPTNTDGSHLSALFKKEAIKQSAQEKKFYFKDVAGHSHYLFMSQIVRLKGERIYTRIYLADRSFLVHRTLTELTDELREGILRIHKSHAVNVWQVEQAKHYKATLKDGTILPISRGEYKKIKETIRNMVENGYIEK